MSPDDRRTRLVCLPFAGAGASFYRPWAESAGEHLEIVALQLPGRERLIDSEPHRTVPAAVDGLLHDLRGRLDGPARVALFGHSLGAVLAYELARRLAASPDIGCAGLFVSGSPAPAACRSRRATGLPDEEFLRRVREFAGYRHEALDDPDMRELILPTLRADVEMHEGYDPGTPEPLDVPITALRGRDDVLVPAEDAAAWAACTVGAFEYVEMPGGHMFVVDAAPSILRLITATVPCA